MGRQTTGIYPGNDGRWHVDKVWRGTRLRESFGSHQEAEGWLIKRLEQLRAALVHGERADRTFGEAAAHYLLTNQTKVSIVTESYLLDKLVPMIGSKSLQHIHDGTLAPFVEERLRDGKSHKTVNLALGVVRRILNLAASSWRDENGVTWLLQAPLITMLPLAGHQREPRPISWSEQRKLLPHLPPHLARMALFVLNTGVRDNVACSLRWDWEIKVPELGTSVFEVPMSKVKGRKRSRIVVCNSVAMSVVESMRDAHAENVFVWRRERVKNLTDAPAMEYRPITAMNNTAWCNARKAAGLGDLHVHDLRHTVGMRLREAGVGEATISDVLWHKTQSMTQHYSVAQIVELHSALERIKVDGGKWNKSLATLKLEQQEAAVSGLTPREVPTQRKTA